MHYCPICGYDGFKSPPDLGMTCPCCGTEFGFHDEFKSHRELRAKWIMNGMTWWSHSRQQPPAWNPTTQLRRLYFAEMQQMRIRRARADEMTKRVKQTRSGYSKGEFAIITGPGKIGFAALKIKGNGPCLV